MAEKQELKQEDVFKFLESLRDSGIMNMFGAVPDIQRKFGVDADEAEKLLFAWMEQ